MKSNLASLFFFDQISQNIFLVGMAERGSEHLFMIALKIKLFSNF